MTAYGQLAELPPGSTLNFVNDDFLLRSEAARRLYHEYAAEEPILDFHSHLPASEIAEDRQFQDLTEIWLNDDHYKWRAMRANGVAERFCTGDAVPYDRFLAWAKTVPFTVRNPLYHWTHLELKRYFGFDGLLNETNAKSVWESANSLLRTPEFSARGILRKFHVQVACTTDDPCDDVAVHQQLNASNSNLCMYPTFRPDRALRVDQPEQFVPWVRRLEEVSNVPIGSFASFLEAIERRHSAFHQAGGRLSDHGLPYCYSYPCSEKDASQIFERALGGRPASADEQEKFAAFLMLFFGQLDAEKGWTKQLHLGALRSVNSRGLHETGPDTGFDNMGDWPQAERLCAYLDLLERENALPKMILYNVNPVDNHAFATIAGSFQRGPEPGKIQFGSAWWFLDQKDGMEAQINALSNIGLLSRFIGMVTDSRSFMSFPRHEYFRRVLCNLLGNEIEKGELPNDFGLAGGMVRNICFANAKHQLGLVLPTKAKPLAESISQR